MRAASVNDTTTRMEFDEVVESADFDRSYRGSDAMNEPMVVGTDGSPRSKPLAGPHSSSYASAPQLDKAEERSAGYVDASYLDNVTAIVASTKRRSYEMLRLTEGSAVVDVGCGPGSDTLALAALVGATGRVVGVDHDPDMVAEANRRSRAAGLANVVHHIGDAASLSLSDGEMTAARADRVFQHVEDVNTALTELLRVVRPGGRVVVADTDWTTMSVDVALPDQRPLERRLAAAALTRRGRSPYAARELPRLFREAGLCDISVEVVAQSLLIPEMIVAALDLEVTLQLAVEHGDLSPAEGASLREAMVGGGFGSVNLVIVAGTRS